MMGIKEGTRCDEHWGLPVSHKSLTFTPETNMLQNKYVNEVKIKLNFF